MEINTPKQLTNRHIARLLTKLEPLKIPELVSDAIKKEMIYLTNDIVSLYDKEVEKNGNYKK